MFADLTINIPKISYLYSMKETFLHYIWFHRLKLQVKYPLSKGSTYTVLDKGLPNADAGPDVLQARIKINEIEWVGNVEFHIKSSDWELHNHHRDAMYNNVILHFVANHNQEVFTENKRSLATAIFPDLDELYTIFQDRFQNNRQIHCEEDFNKVPKIVKTIWFEKMIIERLEKKTTTVFELLAQTQNHWEEVCYRLVARYLGQQLNGDIFERLARNTPLRIISKHRNSLLQLEALLLGQAGYLDEVGTEKYALDLQREYLFLQQKYQLVSLQRHEWKLLRLRPSNFPTIRIAQLAMMLHKSENLFSKLLATQGVKNLRKIFEYGTSEYWEDHYLIGKVSKRKSVKNIGESLQDILIINTLVPILFAYGKYSGDERWKEEAVELLHQISGEKNRLTKAWEVVGVRVKTAHKSQSLIQLMQHYCNFRNCHKCAIGHQILALHYE